MSVRKREWTTRKGEEREAWIVDYTDAGGTRRLKTFARKKEADAWEDSTRVAVRDGVHVADSASCTIARAGKLWITTAEADGLERSTLDQYSQHLRLHIVPFIGGVKLSQLNAPTVRAFEDKLIAAGRSHTLARYVIRSLGSLLADAQERGLIGRNPVRELRARRRHKGNAQRERHKTKLKVGVHIPSTHEIKRILAAATGRWKPLLMVAVFAGLRSSELRGLRWSDVDLKRGEIHVRQRADRYNAIGVPKSSAGERAIPVGASVLTALREWKLQCPKGKLDLAFPNTLGRLEAHSNMVRSGLVPIGVKAGVTDADGEAKYTGMHCLRHFFASMCINRKVDGGLELPPKIVQERLGHTTLALTLDRYSHLFPRGDDNAELAAAERALLG